MHNIKLTLSYDGTNYLGWQKTQMGPSIEGLLENILSTIFQEPIILQAASRTDAGVHASMQIVNFFMSSAIELTKLKIALNSLLPKDIGVNLVEKMHDGFHPTLDCKSKEYHYYVCYGTIQLPHERHYAWHYPRKLCLMKMREAINLLIGEHDFSAFCNAKSTNYVHYKRDLESIHLIELPNQCLRFELKGNNFLYKMVRNLVGTLIYSGCGKINLLEISKILINGDRRKAGMTAPAHGLFLHKINY